MENSNKNAECVETTENNATEVKETGGKRSSKPKNRRKSRKGNINDASYYYPDKMVGEQINNYSFAQFSGVPIDFGFTIGNNNPSYVVPNVMSVRLAPSVPTDYQSGGKPQSGITTVGMRNFTAMSCTNSRTNFQYMGNDITIGILAIGNLLSTISWCKRALGSAYMFNYRNRAYPEEIFEAYRINTTDFRARLANYRVRFNTLMATAQKIPFPATIPYFDKCSHMFEYIYLDGKDSNMAQTYMFNPALVWELDEAYDSNGSGLKTIPFVEGSNSYNFEHYLDILENQIIALLNSTTLNYVYADVLRLVSKGKLSKLIEMPFIPDDYMVRPVISDEISLWIHNMTVIGAPIVDPSTVEPAFTGTTHWNDVSCDTNKNAIKYNPLFTTNFSTNNDHPTNIRLVDYFKENPSLEERVAATRLLTTYDPVPGIASSKYVFNPIVLDWYGVSIQIWRYASDPDTANRSITQSLNPGNDSTFMYQMDYLTKFDWAPIIYDFSPSNSAIKALGGDLNYYTTITGEMLKKMYDYEIINLLEIRM